jgi:phosphoglycolate phosphatase-like HAD superfamily hydrolase
MYMAGSFQEAAVRFRLIVFDVDGTLAVKYGDQLLPGVADFFRYVAQMDEPERPAIALATNQGGVGLRHWMEQEGFGRPQEYPTQPEIESRLARLVATLWAEGPVRVYVAYAYQNRRGRWSPAPAGSEDAPRWQPEWRKPAPGMLLQAMADAGVGPGETLYVGDRQEDEAAARGAGCAFRWADAFFNRE